MLRGSRRGRGHNPTSTPLSRVVTTNAERLRLRRPPSSQLADILSADIPSITDALSTMLRLLREETEEASWLIRV